MEAHATNGIALAHDYLTQRGGAERVVLSIVRAFPRAPLYTSLYDPPATFPEFSSVEVRTSIIDQVWPLRRHHRLALPLLAPAFSRMQINASVAVCSSSGWAHGADVTGRKVVFCHAPARWLYQPDRYLRTSGSAVRVSFGILRSPLIRWDRRAAASAQRYLANSTWIANEIKRIYSIDAEVLHPPSTIDVGAPRQPSEKVEAGFVLCVSRLLPYKNVEVIVRAMHNLPREQLVVAGNGPDEVRLRSIAGENVTFLGAVSDSELRWLYANARCLVTASYEDYGLTPLEAAAFGKPTVALRFGGFLDTVREGVTGLFFDSPDPASVSTSIVETVSTDWDEKAIRVHTQSFSEKQFIARLRVVVDEEAGMAV